MALKQPIKIKGASFLIGDMDILICFRSIRRQHILTIPAYFLASSYGEVSQEYNFGEGISKVKIRQSWFAFRSPKNITK
jgi:hypothetical protein